MKPTIPPLTVDLWPALKDLLGERGGLRCGRVAKPIGNRFSRLILGSSHFGLARDLSTLAAFTFLVVAVGTFAFQRMSM